MASGSKPKLTARGAPILPSHDLRLKTLQQEEVDSGLGDSIKSERLSEECDSGRTTYIEELTRKMSVSDVAEESICDEEAMNSRHPEPCGSPKPSTPSPKLSPVMSPVQNMMNFAQSNDVRHLLAPYRHCLLVQNEDGDTPIHLAVIHNHPHIESLVSLVPCKDYLDIFNHLRQTPLHLAVITRQPSVVSILLEGGASIDMVDRYGKTVLHHACERGDVDTINVLTQFLARAHGPNSWELSMMMEARDYQGFSALHLATKSNSFEVISLLIRLGANVNIQDGTSGRTPLHIAAEDNNLRMVNFLLHNCQASVNAQRNDDNTPLHIAAGRGLLAVFGRLLAAGGDLSISNLDGETPLDHATPEVLNTLKEFL